MVTCVHCQCVHIQWSPELTLKFSFSILLIAKPKPLGLMGLESLKLHTLIEGVGFQIEKKYIRILHFLNIALL